MPCGSSARFIARVSAKPAGPRWSSSHAVLANPVPCSPVTVPPSSQRGAIDLVAGGVDRASRPSGRRGRRRRSGGDCRRRHGRRRRPADPCAADDRARSRSSISGIRLRGTPTSSMRATPARSSEPMRRAARLAQPVGLLGVASAQHRRRAGRLARLLGGRPALLRRQSPPSVRLDHQHRGRAVRSRPSWKASSTAAMVNASISSSVTGTTPAAVMPRHGLAGGADGREEGDHRQLRRRQRQQPQRRLGDQAERPFRADEQPGQVVAGDVLLVLAAGPDDRSPSASTTSRPSTQSRVTPYFTQRRPPEFSARLPPIVHISKLAGSGG